MSLPNLRAVDGLCPMPHLPNSQGVSESCSPLRISGGDGLRSPVQKRKTEICFMWKAGKECRFGKDCNFAHGEQELQSRLRRKNFHSKACEEVARSEESRASCRYIRNGENRCDFAHPGDELRTPMSRDYYDEEYQQVVKERFPRGIYL